MNNYITKPITLELLRDNGYEATPDGKVISYKGRQPRELSAPIGNHGYPVVNLRINGKSSLFMVHRLVAISHLELDETRPLVNHKDGNKANNLLSNLEFVTHSENIQHYYDNCVDSKTDHE